MPRRNLLFLVLNAIVSVAVVLLAWNFLQSRTGGSETQERMVITVPILITATNDPFLTPAIVVVTATPTDIPGSVQLPEGLLPATSVGAVVETQIATLDPTLFLSALDAVQAAGGTALNLPENCIVHTLQEGETPYGIALQYNASFAEILAVNGLSEDDATFLQIGQTLIVPQQGCVLGAQAVALTASATFEPTASFTPSPTETVDGTLTFTPTPPASATTRPTASNTPTVTLTPSSTVPPTAENAQVVIMDVVGVGDVTTESITIRNNGQTIDLFDWSLQDSDGNVFTFPSGRRVFSNGSLIIYSRVGEDTPAALFWGESEALFESGETVTLLDNNGRAQSAFEIP